MRKNAKRFLSIVLAGTMMLSTSMAAMATDTDTDTDMGNQGSSKVEFEGDITVIDTAIVKVTLPTADSLGFNFDPYGLYGYFTATANNAATTADDAALEPYKGKIIGTQHSKISNRSSVPVVVNCDYDLTITGATGVTVVDDATAVTDTGNEIYLAIVGGTVNDAGDVFTKGTAKTAVAADGTEMKVAMDPIAYHFSKDAATGDFGYVATNNNASKDVNFAIEGEMSKDGDWSALENATVKLSCVYSFIAAKDISGATLTDGFVTAGEDAIEYLGSTYSVSSATGGNTVTIDGAAATKTLSSVVLNQSGGSTINLASGTHYTYVAATGVFTVTKSTIITGNTGGYLALTFSDGSTETISIR